MEQQSPFEALKQSEKVNFEEKNSRTFSIWGKKARFKAEVHDKWTAQKGQHEFYIYNVYRQFWYDF